MDSKKVINYERIYEVIKKHGAEVTEAPKCQGGLFLREEDGTERKLELEEILEMCNIKNNKL
jgi:hypothetical protein